jgi:bifunctional UDP-N-acetylglucosamine pyrophosphorylase/glucosamine-1-phosphate N-acetyltransferase
MEEGYANIGIYSLSKEIFEIIELMEKNNSVSPRGEYEIPDAVNKLLEKEKYKTQLVGLEEKDYWFDIGRPWNLLDANETLMTHYKEEREGTVENGVTLKGKIVIKKDAIIRSGVYIEGPVFIDEGADIGPNCYIRSFTYLGKKSRIGNGCEVKNSIIEDNTHAAHLSYIGDSIIGPKCNFGAGTITANLRLDKKTIPVRIKGNKEDSLRRKLGAIIGEGVETGVGALLMPGVKIGNNSWIGAGTIVDEDIPSESIYFGTQKYTLRRKRKNAN